MDETPPTTVADESVESEQDSNLSTQPIDGEQRPRLAFPIVGIGASAGGLEAFTEFFRAVPLDCGMAFVVVQHLPPDRESMIVEILQRHTAMPVQQVLDDMPVQPDHVYIIRPGHTLTIKDGRLHLGERLEKPRHSRPVDDFLNSLAKEQRERAIGIIMSGMGSNGTAGAQAIKAVGGLCIAQDPASAQFPSMPRHLIDAGYADFILRPAEMPDTLLAYARHPYANGAPGALPLIADDQADDKGDGMGNGEAPAPKADHPPANEQVRLELQNLRDILSIVRASTRYDFAGYKKPTVLRRIQRRMGLNRVTDIEQYAQILRQSPIEVTGLTDDLLIHVTGFFRDPQAWDALRQRVIIPLVRDRHADEAIRCWVTACSSGEEAYSLAMLLVEESERQSKPLNIKVFATDTAERTLGNARNGVYPGGIESEMPPERLQRFFDKDDAIYRVRQDLRERVVFAPQNVLSDPPFSRLDIITCRNLLIYLEPEIQKHVVALMHFGLKDGGALFLGSSETVPPGAGLFEPIDKKARLYRRIGPTRHGVVNFPLPHGVPREIPPLQRPPSTAPSVAQLTTRALVAHHIPAAVTVDRQYRIVYFQGNTAPFLSQPTGEPTRDLITLANDDVRGALRTALQRSMAANSVQTVPDGWITNPNGQRRRIVVTVSPLVPAETSELFVVSFQEREAPEPLPPAGVNGDHPADVPQSSEELQRLRAELQGVTEELQAINEEHKAASEEAMSMNEELQSSNEELETSKEEMQSLNEELSTVNAQLHAKMDELQRTSGDLRSLLSSIDIAVIFLDSSLRIRRYTPMAKNLLDLIGTDIGRPLNDLAKKFTDPDLLTDAAAVLERLVPAEREVAAFDGRWYTRRVLPYRTIDDRIGGVVVTFVEITNRKRDQDIAAQAGDAVSGDLKAMTSLHVVSNHLIAATDIQEVLEEILVAAIEFHATDLGDVYLYDSLAGARHLAVQRGFPDNFIEARAALPLDDPADPVALALHQRKPVIISDILHDLPPSPFREKWIAAGVRAMQCLPLLTKGGVLLGVLSLYFRQPHLPDERSQRITDLLARQGSDTIDRMRIDVELTRRLRGEQLARRALDDAAQIKDQFLATLSHELRTPLSAILLWGRMLRSGRLGADDIKEGMDAILNSAEALARLIDDLLDTSRIASGKLRLEMTETDLIQLVHSVIEQNDPAARARELHIETHLSPDAGLVIADATRLRQVVWNLLTNAVKFTPPGGHITVTLERRGGDVIITIADTGAGIDPEFLPFVFDRFRQYDGSHTRKYGGLGLGLAISKQLVELHGGTIHAQSLGVDCGATFTVTLPLPPVLPKPGAVDETPAAANLPLGGLNVLLVEDNRETQKALSRVLRRAGAIVSTASTGAAAVQEYRTAHPQIVLSDIGLPDFDGYTLLGNIRALEHEQNLIPALAVALTAYARDDDRKKAAAAGFCMHLGKPIDGDKLISVLASLGTNDQLPSPRQTAPTATP